MDNTNTSGANKLLSSRVAVYPVTADEVILEYEVTEEEWFNIVAAVHAWDRRHAGFRWDSLGQRNAKGTYPLRLGLSPNLSREAMDNLDATLDPLLVRAGSLPVHAGSNQLL